MTPMSRAATSRPIMIKPTKGTPCSANNVGEPVAEQAHEHPGHEEQHTLGAGPVACGEQLCGPQGVEGLGADARRNAPERGEDDQYRHGDVDEDQQDPGHDAQQSSHAVKVRRLMRSPNFMKPK